MEQVSRKDLCAFQSCESKKLTWESATASCFQTPVCVKMVKTLETNQQANFRSCAFLNHSNRFLFQPDQSRCLRTLSLDRENKGTISVFRFSFIKLVSIFILCGMFALRFFGPKMLSEFDIENAISTAIFFWNGNNFMSLKVNKAWDILYQHASNPLQFPHHYSNVQTAEGVES